MLVNIMFFWYNIKELIKLKVGYFMDDLFDIVEDETLSCGTGVTAVAIAMFVNGLTESKEVNLNVEGGALQVKFQAEKNHFSNVFLTGPATLVFEGTVSI